MEPPHHQTSRLIPLHQRSGWVGELYSQIIVDRLEQSVRIGAHETDLRDDIKRHLSKLLIKVPSRTLQEVLDPITSRAWIAEFQNETSLQVLQLGKLYQDTDVLKRYKTHLANPPEVVTTPHEPFLVNHPTSIASYGAAGAHQQRLRVQSHPQPSSMNRLPYDQPTAGPIEALSLPWNDPAYHPVYQHLENTRFFTDPSVQPRNTTDVQFATNAMGDQSSATYPYAYSFGTQPQYTPHTLPFPTETQPRNTRYTIPYATGMQPQYTPYTDLYSMNHTPFLHLNPSTNSIQMPLANPSTQRLPAPRRRLYSEPTPYARSSVTSSASSAISARSNPQGPTGMDIACVGSWHWEKILRAIGLFLEIKWIEIEKLAGTAMDVRGRADEEISGTIQTLLERSMGQTLWYGAAICEMTGNRTTVMGGLIVDTSFVRMIFSGSDQIVIIETPMPTSSESGNSTSSEFGFSQLVADFRQGKSFPHSLATRTGATALLDLAVAGIKLTEAGETAEVGGGPELMNPRELPLSPENILLAGLSSATGYSTANRVRRNRTRTTSSTETTPSHPSGTTSSSSGPSSGRGGGRRGIRGILSPLSTIEPAPFHESGGGRGNENRGNRGGYGWSGQQWARDAAFSGVPHRLPPSPASTKSTFKKISMPVQEHQEHLMPVQERQEHLPLNKSDIEQWSRDLPEQFEVVTDIPLETKPEWKVRRVSVSTFNRLLEEISQ